jgi:hypothetical protein
VLNSLEAAGRSQRRDRSVAVLSQRPFPKTSPKRLTTRRRRTTSDLDLIAAERVARNPRAKSRWVGVTG